MKYFLGFPIWVMAASVWLRKGQTPVQQAEEISKDLRLYVERLDALKYHTPLPGNRFEAWLVKQICEWIDAERSAARGMVMGAIEEIVN